MFEKPRISYAILVLLFILPQSIFVIGDFMAWGIRFPLFRFQDSPLGSSVIPLNRELGYVTSGTIKWTGSYGGLNPTAVAPWIWLAGVLALVAAAGMILSWHLLDNPGYAVFAGPLVILSGVIFLVWAVVQTGSPFIGPSGYSIPVGIPFLWYCGYKFMRVAKSEGEAGDE